MRELDLSPLYHSTVGFDSLVSVFDQIAGFQNEATTYPPYNIERSAENEYRITMAVAGFDKHDIEIEVNEGILSIRYVEVKSADVKDGLLSVDLEREVPERLKPRTIEIGAIVAKGAENKLVDALVAAK